MLLAASDWLGELRTVWRQGGRETWLQAGCTLPPVTPSPLAGRHSISVLFPEQTERRGKRPRSYDRRPPRSCARPRSSDPALRVLRSSPLLSTSPAPPSVLPSPPPAISPCSSFVLTSYSLIRSVPKASSYLPTFALPRLYASLLFHQPNLSSPLHTFWNNVHFDQHLASKPTKWSF